MYEEEINTLVENGYFEGEPLSGELIETHISWIILSGDYAFKIKKPLKLSFLDFSTLEQRKLNCDLEVKLNSRYSDIYYGVEPVFQKGGKWQIGGEADDVQDFAVKMKRMEEKSRMDHLIHNEQLEEADIRKLAKVVANFHMKAPVITTPFDLTFAQNTFNDLLSLEETVKHEVNIGLLQKAVNWSDKLLEKYSQTFQKRIDLGLKRDVHGDLHTGNIFIKEQPVIFDCIEFDKNFRQIDVLYEVAFLCMDLEAAGRKGFAQSFLDEYNRHFASLKDEEDLALFIYFKCLRANIRAKVMGLRAVQSRDTKEKQAYLSEMEKYLGMVGEYMEQCKP